MAETTTIEITKSRWKELNGRKEPGDSFDDVIRRLLEEDQGDDVDAQKAGETDGGDDVEGQIEAIKTAARENL